MILSITYRIIISLILFFLPEYNFAQETNSNVSGIVKSEKNELLQNATVVVVHEPTKNTYTTQTNEKGFFYFFNIKTGGSFTITITYSCFET